MNVCKMRIDCESRFWRNFFFRLVVPLITCYLFFIINDRLTIGLLQLKSMCHWRRSVKIQWYLCGCGTTTDGLRKDGAKIDIDIQTKGQISWADEKKWARASRVLLSSFGYIIVWFVLNALKLFATLKYQEYNNSGFIQN